MLGGHSRYQQVDVTYISYNLLLIRDLLEMLLYGSLIWCFNVGP